MHESKIIYSPYRQAHLSVSDSVDKISIFLAGSIEMGKAIDWQSSLSAALANMSEVCAVFNPRRLDWDSSWVQSIDNPQFNEQVNWELDHIERADLVFMNFVGDTKSPITLAELGLLLGQGKKPIIVCPDNFWRQGNVQIMAQRAGLKIHRDFDSGVADLINQIRSLYNA